MKTTDDLLELGTMHVTKTQNSKTEITLHITATAEDMEPIKQKVLKVLARNLKVAGFREGKVPLQVAEKNIDPTTLQTEFLDEAMTQLYASATQIENVRPVTQPKVDVKKFVPFTTLEFDVTISILGPVKLGKYKGLKSSVSAKKVLEADISSVMNNLLVRMSTRTPVDRGAKNDDELIIDFSGKDDKDQPINGADGKDYPLTLGSNSFIPGFEDNLIGIKAGKEKSFELTFPKDYGVKALASKKVTFTVNVKTVNEMSKPELTDEFAGTVGPFKTLKELETDIKTQLTHEAEQESLRAKQNDLVGQFVDDSEVALPDALVQQQVQFELEDARRNLNYRGQTYEEFLEFEGTTDEQYKKDVLVPRATMQVKTAILLSEVAEVENINVTPEELEIQLQVLKGQYTDPAMQAELDKEEARRDIASRILSQKVVNFIVEQSV